MSVPRIKGVMLGGSVKERGRGKSVTLRFILSDLFRAKWRK
jgi:hypothetical protein